MFFDVVVNLLFSPYNEYPKTHRAKISMVALLPGFHFTAYGFGFYKMDFLGSVGFYKGPQHSAIREPAPADINELWATATVRLDAFYQVFFDSIF